MSEAIKAALITGGIALLGIIVTIVLSNIKRKEEHTKFVNELLVKLDKQSELSDTKLEAKLDRTQAVTDTKIDELTREVRKHNNFAERIPVLEEQIKVANHRIDDLERSGK